MSDIFDDIDEILGDTAGDDATATTETEGENFNEAELQDIMSEIESLEKDFEDGSTMEAAAMIQDAVMEEINAELTKDSGPKDSLQEQIERELEASMTTAGGDPEEVTPVIIAPVITASAPVEKVEAAVLNFEKPAPKAPVMTEPTMTAPAMIAPTGSGVSFAASGSMALTLDFKVGAENAKLTIDPVKGLTVVLAGVELVISESEGCLVTMDNGMKFTVPLSSLEKSQKKSA